MVDLSTWQLLQNVITIIAVVGSALSVYLNLQKIGMKSKEDAVWKALVDKNLKDITCLVKDIRAEINEFKEMEKDNSARIREIEIKLESQQRNQDKMWRVMDELRGKGHSN